MNKFHRYVTSLIMTTIYLVIVFSPLAPLAMQSKLVAHAVTGECTGDCRIDGCSLERSAAHTCCCRQKKQTEASHPHENDDVTQPAPSAEVPQTGSKCCKVQVVKKSESTSGTSPQNKSTTVSTPPCGSGKLFALLSAETTHHLPFFFSGEFTSPVVSSLTFPPPDRLASRFGDPPDPPPIITRAS